MPISSTFLVEVDGSALPPDLGGLLTEACVEDSQRLPDMFTLRFRDIGRAVLDRSGATIGSTVRISVQTADGQEPTLLISGEVTAVEAEFDSGGSFTLIRGYDPAHRLFRGRRTAAYTQVTASDVVTAVVQRAGLPTGEIAATSTVHDQVSQTGQTDWELLESLAREVGYELSVREGTVSFGPPRQASEAPDPGAPGTRVPLVLRLGSDLLRLRAVLTSAQQVEEVEVRGWDVTTKQPLTATEPSGTDRIDLPDADPQQLAAAFGGGTYTSTDVPYGTQAEVDAVATSLAAEIGGSFAALEGVARGNPELRADAAVSMVNLGSPFDGKYTVTSSRHRFDPGTGYTTRFTVSGRSDRSLLSLAASAPPRRGPGGVVVGLVTDVNDPEELGRVKVQLPWLDDDFVSDWVRTLQPGAAKDRGWTVVPEVGDEVLVAFEQADFRRPYVLGGLYNGVDTPSRTGPPLVDGATGAINRRSLVSRRGHRLDLLDQDGKAEGVSLRTGDDALVLSLDATDTRITLRSDGTVVVEGTRGVVVDAAEADLELKGGKVTITGSQGVDLDGGAGNVSVTAGAQLALSGTTAKLEGSATTEVKGGATCSVSAGLVRIN